MHDGYSTYLRVISLIMMIIYKLFYEEQYMVGYKGIELRKGILRAKSNGTGDGDIFEIGIPKQIVHVDDGFAFSENGYSFCGTIEAVLEWMDYLTENKYRNKSVDMRLFEIDTLGSKVIGGNTHYKATQIVVNREITSKEIIQYFKEYPDKLISEENKEKFNKYCLDQPQPYKLIIDKHEIDKLMVKSCFRFRQESFCVQEKTSTDMDKCKICPGKNIKGDVFYDLSDYQYLIARSKLYNGAELSTIEEYGLLANNTVAKKNLELQSSWLKNK